eukprot:7219671-Prymnesium_polylepis.1
MFRTAVAGSVHIRSADSTAQRVALWVRIVLTHAADDNHPRDGARCGAVRSRKAEAARRLTDFLVECAGAAALASGLGDLGAECAGAALSQPGNNVLWCINLRTWAWSGRICCPPSILENTSATAAATRRRRSPQSRPRSALLAAASSRTGSASRFVGLNRWSPHPGCRCRRHLRTMMKRRLRTRFGLCCWHPTHSTELRPQVHDTTIRTAS